MKRVANNKKNMNTMLREIVRKLGSEILISCT